MRSANSQAVMVEALRLQGGRRDRGGTDDAGEDAGLQSSEETTSEEDSIFEMDM